MLNLKINKENLFYISIICIFFIGIILRLTFFLYQRPFWNDECALALNLVNKTFFQLFGTLDYEQNTPPLFSVFTKLFDFIPLKKELTYRFSSFIFGLISIPLFWLFAKKNLKNKFSIIFATVIFSLTYRIIYYCAELKQYSCDLSLFIAILLTYFYIKNKNINILTMFALSLFYAISIWFSYTSIFAIVTVFITTLLSSYVPTKKIINKQAITHLFITFSIPAISFTSLFWLQKRFLSDNLLITFWQNGFIEKDFTNLFNIIEQNLAFYYSSQIFQIIMLILFIIGIIYIFLEKRKRNILLVLPVFFALLLSYLHIYPLMQRTSLYLFPIFILICSKPLELIAKSNKTKVIAISLIILAISVTLSDCINKIIKKNYYQETTPQILSLIDKYAQNNTDKNIIIIPKLTTINYTYYKKEQLNAREIFVLEPLYTYEEIKKVFDTLPLNKNYYLIFTHSSNRALEYTNLKKYVLEQKDSKVFSDNQDNSLMLFKK